MPQPTFQDAAKHCTCGTLRKASRAITQHYDRILAPFGLRATQFTILATAAATGPSSMSELARNLVMDRSTLSRNIRPLIQAGLIKTVAITGRTRQVHLTEEGEDKLNKAVQVWAKAEDQLRENLGDDRVKQIHELAQSVVRGVYEIADSN